jgi:hypothetical protein
MSQMPNIAEGILTSLMYGSTPSYHNAVVSLGEGIKESHENVDIALSHYDLFKKIWA